MSKKQSNWGGKRQGAGRPGYQEPLTTISLRIPLKDAERFREAAKKRGLTQAGLFLDLIDNPHFK